MLETVKALSDRGVSLVSLTDGSDSSTPAGWMMIGVLGSLAEYESETDSRAHGVEASSVAVFFVFTTSDDHALTAPTSANTPHTDLQL